MDEQTQQEFVSWLTQQLGVQSEDELQEQMNQMGDEGIQQAFQVFQKEKSTPMNQEGGKLEYLKKLQQGGGIYSPIQKEYVTDANVAAYKKQGMDFGTKEALAGWLDQWGSKPKPEAPAANVAMPPKMIRRYNQASRSYEDVPVQQVMAEPNSINVGQPGAWGKWDTSSFKKQVTPQDTIGMNPQVRNNVQAGWDIQGVHPKPMTATASLASRYAKGGSIKEGKQDDKSALDITKWTKGKDGKTALYRRKEKGMTQKTALKGIMDKGKDGKTAVGITDWVKGKDAKTGLNRRKDSGTNTHTALNKK